MMFDVLAGRRLKAVVGHYGSGKTEFSLNLALAARAMGCETALVDLDIVNPFFRSAEQVGRLAASGVELIAPPYALTGVDLPVLSARVHSVFERQSLYTVLDVGGDDAGAAALGRYKPRFDENPYDLYYVVNPYRPYSETPDQVLSLLERIERRSRLRVTGLVNNANLGALTEPSNLLEGQEFLEEVARRASLEIVCASGLSSVLRALPADFPVPCFPIERLLMPEYLL